jgi:hypothetical protein
MPKGGDRDGVAVSSLRGTAGTAGSGSVTAGTPCGICTTAVQQRKHEPFLVDDVPTWSRMWRCSRCGALWMEGDRYATPISESDADQQLMGWRERASWLAEVTTPALLQAYRAGRLGDELFALAFLHHDLLGTDVDVSDPADLVLYSSADATIADGRDPAELTWDSVARRLRWTSGRRRVRIDPASPWRCDPGAYVVEFLDANGRRTETESDRRREAACDER